MIGWENDRGAYFINKLQEQTEQMSEHIEEMSDDIDDMGDDIGDMGDQIDTLSENVTSALSDITALQGNRPFYAKTSWGSSITAKPFSVGIMLIGTELFVVWCPASTDISITHLSANSSYGWTKNGTASVTFGINSASGTDYTLARNGNEITVTLGSGQTAFLIIYG